MVIKKLWFRGKRYGWGWRPVTWQGWMVTLVYVAVVVLSFLEIERDSRSAYDTFIGVFPRVFIATLLLVLICYRTGKKR